MTGYHNGELISQCDHRLFDPEDFDENGVCYTCKKGAGQIAEEIDNLTGDVGSTH